MHQVKSKMRCALLKSWGKEDIWTNQHPSSQKKKREEPKTQHGKRASIKIGM